MIFRRQLHDSDQARTGGETGSCSATAGVASVEASPLPRSTRAVSPARELAYIGLKWTWTIVFAVGTNVHVAPWPAHGGIIHMSNIMLPVGVATSVA
jgi:hypothetical protein